MFRSSYTRSMSCLFLCFFSEEIPCLDCSVQVIVSGISGAVVGAVLILVAVVVILIKKGIISEYNLIMPEVLSSKV